MQHVVSTHLTYPGSCKTCFSHKPVFGGKISLIFLIIYQIAHLHNWPTYPLIFANSCPGCQNYLVLTGLVGKRSNSLSLLTDLIETRCACILSFFRPFQHTNYIKIIRLVDLIMPKPVFLMTVHEAHMEYNSLIDQIQAKYELLDSGECGSVGTPAFNAECPRNFTGPCNSSTELL